MDDQLTNYFCASSQSNIFNNYDSYNENLEFHGYQLSIKCNYHKVYQPPPSTLQQEDNFESKNGFSWKVVSIGYGYGVIFGIFSRFVGT